MVAFLYFSRFGCLIIKLRGKLSFPFKVTYTLHLLSVMVLLYVEKKLFHHTAMILVIYMGNSQCEYGFIKRKSIWNSLAFTRYHDVNF